MGLLSWFRGRAHRGSLGERLEAASPRQHEARRSSVRSGVSGVWPTSSRVVDGSDVYDNLFPYVSVIAQHASVVRPFAINLADGEKLDKLPQPLQALQAPNDTFSGMEFVNYLVTCLLVNQWVDLLVWDLEGNPGWVTGKDGIGGYTFLPGSSRCNFGDHLEWHVDLPGYGQCVFDRSSVLSLSFGRHPSDLSVGVAPGLTVAKWADVDDLLADYERGFFGNSAVPAGMLEIVASSVEEYEDTKRELEARFRGARNTNGVVYNYRPLDPFTLDSVGPAKLSWVPFSSSNSQLDLAGVNGMVGERLANALAVPDIVRGIDHGQTYANAEQAQRTFVESTLRPFLLRLWDKFGFELSRVCGGLDWRIGFDLVLPAQTDVERVRADTVSVFVDTLCKLVDRGVSVSDAVGALGLGDEWLSLEGLGADAGAGGVSSSLRDGWRGFVDDGLGDVDSDLVLSEFRELLEQVCDGVEEYADVPIGQLAEWTAGFVTVALVLLLQWLVDAGVSTMRNVVEQVDGRQTLDGLVLTVEGWLESERDTWSKELTDLVEQSLQSFIRVAGDADTGRTMIDWWSKRFVDTLARRVQVDGSIQAVELFQAVYPEYRIESVWRAHLDGSTCDECLSLHGQRVLFGNSFPGGITRPPEHPNCRCWLDFVVSKV